MDELDVRIVREMGVRPYEGRPKHRDALKPSRIAQQVGASINTVKARIARMESAGVIAGYRLVPNLRHLGLTGSAYYFALPTDEDKAALIEGVGRVDGLLELHDFLGRGFCVDFAHEGTPGLADALRELSKLTDVAQPVKFYERDSPPVERALTTLDWKILHALGSNATASLDEVGAQLGVTGRTVRSRYARMAAEGSFFSVPMFDPSRAEGLFLFEILLYVHPGALHSASAELLKAYHANHVYSYVPSSPEMGHFDVLLFAHSTAEVEELRQQAADIPGVERAEAWLFRGLHDHSGWLDDAMAARIRGEHLAAGKRRA